MTIVCLSKIYWLFLFIYIKRNWNWKTVHFNCCLENFGTFLTIWWLYSISWTSKKSMVIFLHMYIHMVFLQFKMFQNEWRFLSAILFYNILGQLGLRSFVILICIEHLSRTIKVAYFSLHTTYLYCSFETRHSIRAKLHT